MSKCPTKKKAPPARKLPGTIVLPLNRGFDDEKEMNGYLGALYPHMVKIHKTFWRSQLYCEIVIPQPKG